MGASDDDESTHIPLSYGITAIVLFFFFSLVSIRIYIVSRPKPSFIMHEIVERKSFFR